MTSEVIRAEIRSGVRIEIFTVVWMAIEAGVGIGAGIAAGSILLTAFGIDSVIELVSGAVLLWRLSTEAGGQDLERVEHTERHAAWIVAISLLLLCVYVLVTAVYGLVAQSHAERSPVGIGLAVASVVVMPWLALTKRRIAGRIGSAALRGDAASSLTCGYMAGTVLVGLALNAVFGWWWAEDVAALAFLIWLARETREALEETRE